MATKKSNNAVSLWSDKLAEIAAAEAAKEVIGDLIPQLSIRNGIMRIGDNQIPGNRIAVVIACNVFENAYYNTAYDPDAIVPPACYAFGTDSAEMAPTDLVKDKQSDSCAECSNNMFGSADTGKGKACGNRRKLVCVPAGEYNSKTNEWAIETDADEFANATAAVLSIPPTSLVEYSKYVKTLAKEHKRPSNAVITEIKVVPDDKRQFVVKFNFIDYIDEDVYLSILDRQEDFMNALTTPYTYPQEDEISKNKAPQRKSKTSRK